MAAALVLISAGMLVATSVQLSYWKNTRALFEHAARVTRRNPLAVTILGSLLAEEGKLDQAIPFYQAALTYKPGYPEAHFFLGNALDRKGHLDAAIAEYKKALWFRPMQEQTHICLGTALAKQNKLDEAAAHDRAAIKVNPESAVAHNNLARVLHSQGKFDEATEHYRAALWLEPGLAAAHNNLGILLLQKGSVADGAAQLREAVRLNPANAESQYNLALALNQEGQWAAAAELFAKTVPGASDPEAHYQYGLALSNLNRFREAISEYATSLLARPDSADALDGLAWLLATVPANSQRNGAEAVRMAERACDLTRHQDAAKLKSLAAAYAETGRFAEAIATATTAQDIANKTSKNNLAGLCSKMLQSFEHGEPWRLRER